MIATITSTTWQIAGVGVGVVFCILILLVFILQIFTLVAKKTHATVKVVQQDVNVKKLVQGFADASEEDKAAVAVALYLYFDEAHDHESGVLTHTYTEHHWRRELNPQL